MQRLSSYVECWNSNGLGRAFNPSSPLRSFIFSLGVLAVFSLSGCGGAGSSSSAGGGGGGKTTPPPPPSYTIGGTTSGLSGTGLVLQNNAGDSLTVSANGSFTFATSITSGSTYSVSVLTQPTNPVQSCVVSNGQGTATATVTSVLVTCTTTAVPTYSIGGTVSGLSGSGLVLENNSTDDLSVTASGTFTFATKIAAGGTYNVTVKTQPASPTQTCSVTNNMGTVSAAVSDVTVTCSTTTYTIGGTLSGLTNGSLVLQDNNTDNLSLSANGKFTFLTQIASGATYSVKVLTQPSKQFCSITNGSGTAEAAVTNVAVACAPTSGTAITQSFFGADFLLTGLIWPGTDGLGRIATWEACAFGTMR